MTLSTKEDPSASVQATCRAIDAACRAQGGVYAEYRCQSVSWDDGQRGTTPNNNLSCWGGNITDTRLYEKSGKLLYTCRSDNWNEKLGTVSAHQVALIVETEPGRLEPMTLADYLQKAGQYGSYAGNNKSTNLYDAGLDDQVSIRFQTTFLPTETNFQTREFSTVEFCTQAYNYNTISNTSPRNVILLCTTQGTTLSQDEAGAQSLFHNRVDDGHVHRHWLEAESTKHKVGAAQHETRSEARAAASRGKATSTVIGVPAMGTRFNTLMTIQVPLRQHTRNFSSGNGEEHIPFGKLVSGTTGRGEWCGEWYPCTVQQQNWYLKTLRVKWEDGTVTSSLPACKFVRDLWWDGGDTVKGAAACMETYTQNEEGGEEEEEDDDDDSFGIGPDLFGNDGDHDDEDDSRLSPKVGTACAARVSRGSEVEGPLWSGVRQRNPLRDTQQHVTVTVVLYNIVEGGIPPTEDVKAAIDDMEELYRSCSWTGHLADDGATFMKSELTVGETLQIAQKITTQPHQAPSLLVENGQVFPTSQTAK